ncbi:hypothetical protein SPI_00623 [Niveomyces insectorum RCEF 264]|uniref:Uncharacterized protein n=1 Tax=Niveomyces insectorum RCEF 264 TaxID=1081102 RepID=A0A168A9D5_9HYPO|nr:hypothetical protein SPI_00623 [Niveomyces insectorum RCEF 264]
MATFEMPPVQFERDIRSAHNNVKRHKNAVSKWSFGARPLPGLKRGFDWDPSDDDYKVRPSSKHSDLHRDYKPHHNIMKQNWGYGLLPAGRVRRHVNARDEIADAARSLGDLSSSVHHHQQQQQQRSLPGPLSADAANVLYSFDNTDSPPPVLPLDAFLKPNVRATEKLVEKEYEVLDDNGEAIKGRRARQVLRKAAATAAVATPSAQPFVELLDEDEFELV